MGWVRDRFRDDSDYDKLIPQLWNEMRDSIADAVKEFNEFTSNASTKFLRSKDCAAMGTYCRRVSSNVGGDAYIEVFLQEDERALKTSSPSNTAETFICGFRLREDRSMAEFFINAAEGQIVIPADQACRLALESFMFPASKAASA